VLASSGSAKAAGRFLAAAGHGQHARFTDPDQAREKADFVIEWVLGRVDATDAQIEQVKGLVGSSMDEVWPLAELHRSNRTVLVTELSQPTIDRNAVEEIRRSEIELADQVSNRLINTLVDVAESLVTTEEVDMLALLAEEGARTHSTVTGKPINIQGDPRLLRRMVRNLLENAERYAGESPVEASVVPSGPAGARLRVEDRGPGVPEAERERIFQPFYSIDLRDYTKRRTEAWAWVSPWCAGLPAITKAKRGVFREKVAAPASRSL
jgi:hypothetical protein